MQIQDLLKDLCHHINGLKRLRISSIETSQINDEIISSSIVLFISYSSSILGICKLFLDSLKEFIKFLNEKNEYKCFSKGVLC